MQRFLFADMHTVRHRVMETDGFWPASQFPTSAWKPERQPASFQSSRCPHVRYVVIVATTGCLHPSFSRRPHKFRFVDGGALVLHPSSDESVLDRRTTFGTEVRCCWLPFGHDSEAVCNFHLGRCASPSVFFPSRTHIFQKEQPEQSGLTATPAFARPTAYPSSGA